MRSLRESDFAPMETQLLVTISYELQHKSSTTNNVGVVIYNLQGSQLLSPISLLHGFTGVRKPAQAIARVLGFFTKGREQV